MEFTARTDGLVVEELDSGLVVYDTRSDTAHWLDGTTTAVWRSCAEPRTDFAIAKAAGVDLATASASLEHLIEIGIVEEAGASYSRRTVLRTAAKVGAAGVAAAPIVSAVIPVAAAHASTTPGSTGSPGGCQDVCTPENNQTVAASGTTPTQVQLPDGTTTPALYDSNQYFGPIPDTSYISPNGDGGNFPVGDYFYTVNTPITVPCSATSATLHVEYYSDNVGTVYLNGSAVANSSNNPCGDNEGHNFGSNGDPPTSVDITLTPGSSNTLAFNVYNCGPSANPTALDYLATLTITCGSGLGSA